MIKYIKIFKSLSSSLIFSEKVVLISSVFGLITTLFPWFSTKNISHNAFNGICAVMGYFFSIFMISCIALILFKIKNKYLEAKIKEHNWIYLFLVGQSLFISICSLLIYYAYGFSSPYSSVGVGLYLAAISQVVGLFGAHYFLINYYKKTYLDKKV